MVVGVVWLGLVGGLGASLDELERERGVAVRASDSRTLLAINAKVLDLIDAGSVETARDFRRASKLITDARFRFETSRVRHELTLAALARESQTQPGEIAKTWDALLLSTGRSQRVGSYGEAFPVEAAPLSILAVMRRPTEARGAAARRKSDSEIERIVQADQKDRSRDWSRLSPGQLQEIGKQDRRRKARILQLLRAGKVVTATDFVRASLVLQHGSGWKDYMLAHELSICSLLLGSSEGGWLAAATYDRMLVSAGYRQRFGTQYSSEGNAPLQFDLYDTRAINDAMRKAMGCPSLAESRDRRFD